MTPPADLLNLVLALVFLAGCVGIHAGRHRPSDVTLLLVLALIGTVNLFGVAVMSRLGPAMDPHQAALIASARPRHD